MWRGVRVCVCLTSIFTTNNSSVVSPVVPECAMKRSATFNEIHIPTHDIIQPDSVI